jgi:hypothetical protein
MYIYVCLYIYIYIIHEYIFTCMYIYIYSVGHTVARHGQGLVDALQLEFGGFLRTVAMRGLVAKAIGEAILRYTYKYMY